MFIFQCRCGSLIDNVLYNKTVLFCADMKIQSADWWCDSHCTHGLLSKHRKKNVFCKLLVMITTSNGNNFLLLITRNSILCSTGWYILVNEKMSERMSVCNSLSLVKARMFECVLKSCHFTKCKGQRYLVP